MEAVIKLPLPTMILDGQRFGLIKFLGSDEDYVDGHEIDRRTKAMSNLADRLDAELLWKNQKDIPAAWRPITPLFVGTTKKGPRGYRGFAYLWWCNNPRFQQWHLDDRWIDLGFGKHCLLVCRVLELTFEAEHLVLPSL